LLLAALAGIVAYANTVSSQKARSEPAKSPPLPWDLRELCGWLSNGTERHFGKQNIPYDEAELERARKSGDASEIVQAELRLSQTLLFLDPARASAAIEHLQNALELATKVGQSTQRVADLEFLLGLAYLRSGEISHCIERHNPERCLFPIRGQGVWTDTSGALAAIDHFLACLRLDPENTGARWLLTVAHMAAGEDSRGVPPELLMSPPPPDPEGHVPKFPDRAPELGVDTFNGAGGAVLDDVDGDGWLDILTTSIFPCEPIHFYHNEGDGSFADWSERSRLSEQLGGLSVVPADYDGDGRLDFFVPRGAWLSDEYGKQRRSLVHQLEGVLFEDTTRAAGLGESAWPDYDDDGDMDLYVGNERHPCELFRNRGDGTFEDVTEAAGVPNGGMTKGVAFGDYDNDGDQDLYVSNLGQPNLLYQNQGDGTFRDVAAELGVTSNVPTSPQEPGDGDLTFSTWFFDYDNDGWLDLFVAGFGGTLTDWANDYLGLPSGGTRSALYHNEGGRFRDVTRETGLYRVLLPMGANYGDIDKDGFPDIYLGTGKPEFEYLVPNVMFRNVSGKRFADVTTEAGVGHLQKGHGVAFGDVDNDGDQDLFAQMGGFFLADAFHDALFENPGNANHWITLVLRGARSNVFGFGARIRVDVTTPQGPRSFHTVGGPTGSFGASSLQQEIGLGDALRIDRLEVYWPTSETRQVFTDVDLDRFYEVDERDPALKPLERRAVRLGGRTD